MRTYEVVYYAVEQSRNIPARIAFLLSIYIGLTAISTWYATARGYKKSSGFLLSFLITPVLASVWFKVRPKN